VPTRSPHRIAEELPPRHAVLGTIPSDSHTWNLLFLQAMMAECGWSVTNLGACVPVPVLVDESLRRRPDMIVISTLNGHGAQEGLDVITALRAEPSLYRVPVCLGGKLGVSEVEQQGAIDDLIAAGYDAVLVGDGAVPAFRTLLDQVTTAPGPYAERAA